MKLQSFILTTALLTENKIYIRSLTNLLEPKIVNNHFQKLCFGFYSQENIQLKKKFKNFKLSFTIEVS